MAEAFHKSHVGGSHTKESTEIGDNLECAVCLQNCVHPAQLPCGHIFCFLCVKGIANQSKKCAMCRQEIPKDFIEQPNLLEKPYQKETEGFDGGYQWFYEGKNGWWQYDERTSKEIEAAYKRGEQTSELLIAGFLYIIDLENMLQLRRNEPGRRRKIKRDFATIPKKGIAGLRTPEINNSPEVGITGGSLGPVTPSNTPRGSTSGRESPELQETIDRITSLQLDSVLNDR
ncbi:E3 ubiquitin-protein ligase rnf146-like [Tribolium madens]|uniref:E3 ubiquitin-protein ligase rnf146-like n=1 Tax=Tribolium madens TaxID=41895 RepID=UPI001CF733C3|nr:E3 ubiquitin-protein ligase rnf146-like [Tribolium madens]